MKYPKFLEPGKSVIGLCAPSDGKADELDCKRLDNAIKKFNTRGYEVLEAEHCRTSVNGRSADGRTRGLEFNSLVNDPSVSAIMAVSGGDYLFEMLEHVDFEALAEKPKWVEGMSDPTGLTYLATTLSDVASVYGVNVGAFGMEEWDQSLEENFKLLEGERIPRRSRERYQSGFQDYVTGLESYELDAQTSIRALTGEASASFTGRMIGGCMDVLVGLLGTRFDRTKEFIDKYKDDGFIWYLEVFSMTPELLSFYLWKFKEAGYFKNVKGFIFGRPCFINTDFSNSTYEEALITSLKDFGVPVIIGMDFGHRPPSNAIINGSLGTVEYENGKTILTERLV